MCSRYDMMASAAELARRFGLSNVPPLANRQEFRPTDQALVIRGKTGGELLRWGLPAPWDPGRPLINARAESLSQKPSFKPHLQNRIIVPATGWTEWRIEGGARLKNHLNSPDLPLLAFAGLSDGSAFTIVTCQPAPSIAHVHDRMPVILSPEAEAAWIDPARPFDQVADLLVPFAGPLSATEDTPPPPRQGDLFG